MTHFILFAILFSLFFFVVPPTSAQNNPPPDVREAARKVMMPIVYKIAGTEQVKIVRNLKYAETSDPNILMDVYQPPGLAKTEKRPAVIFIHGAAKPEYKPKDWGVYASWGRTIAASGLVGVTFTHQLEYPGRSLENAGKDVTDAIAYIRANADKYNIDKDRICLIAFSAGGSMLSLPMRGGMPFVKCLVGFYTFMDIGQSDYQKTETPEIIKSFSPISYLEKTADKLPPIFIARAGRDAVPTVNDSIDRFTKEAIAKNVALSFVNHPKGVHSFDNQNNDERSREIIRQAIEFIKTQLPGN